jgi:hypothetical protein
VQNRANYVILLENIFIFLILHFARCYNDVGTRIYLVKSGRSLNDVRVEIWIGEEATSLRVQRIILSNKLLPSLVSDEFLTRLKGIFRGRGLDESCRYSNELSNAL